MCILTSYTQLLFSLPAAMLAYIQRAMSCSSRSVETECNKQEQKEKTTDLSNIENLQKEVSQQLGGAAESRSKKRAEKEDNIELGGTRETESGNERMEPREKDEEDSNEAQETGNVRVERSIQVLDGDMALGSVQWRDCRAETAGRIQVENMGTWL